MPEEKALNAYQACMAELEKTQPNMGVVLSSAKACLSEYQGQTEDFSQPFQDAQAEMSSLLTSLEKVNTGGSAAIFRAGRTLKKGPKKVRDLLDKRFDSNQAISDREKVFCERCQSILVAISSKIASVKFESKSMTSGKVRTTINEALPNSLQKMANSFYALTTLSTTAAATEEKSDDTLGPSETKLTGATQADSIVQSLSEVGQAPKNSEETNTDKDESALQNADSTIADSQIIYSSDDESQSTASDTPSFVAETDLTASSSTPPQATTPGQQRRIAKEAYEAAQSKVRNLEETIAENTASLETTNADLKKAQKAVDGFSKAKTYNEQASNANPDQIGALLKTVEAAIEKDTDKLESRWSKVKKMETKTLSQKVAKINAARQIFHEVRGTGYGFGKIWRNRAFDQAIKQITTFTEQVGGKDQDSNEQSILSRMKSNLANSEEAAQKLNEWQSTLGRLQEQQKTLESNLSQNSEALTQAQSELESAKAAFELADQAARLQAARAFRALKEPDPSITANASTDKQQSTAFAKFKSLFRLFTLPRFSFKLPSFSFSRFFNRSGGKEGSVTTNAKNDASLKIGGVGRNPATAKSLGGSESAKPEDGGGPRMGELVKAASQGASTNEAAQPNPSP